MRQSSRTQEKITAWPGPPLVIPSKAKGPWGRSRGARLSFYHGFLRKYLALQNDLRNRLFRRMRDGKRCVLHAQFGRKLGGFSVKRNRSPAAWHAHHFTIAPAHPVIPSRA